MTWSLIKQENVFMVWHTGSNLPLPCLWWKRRCDLLKSSPNIHIPSRIQTRDM